MAKSFLSGSFGKTGRLVSICLLFVSTMAQASTIKPIQNNFQVKTYTLSNGMEVWINEDHHFPLVYGAVVVKAGAKDCPNTGIAHYFEHIMFKGTDKIGTLDYAKEKVFLDEIDQEYTHLKNTTDPAQRTEIQKKINALSIQAAQFAVPNEFNQLISDFGGSHVNAFTSYDLTAYFNFLTPQNLEPWMKIYSDRLTHPVFRLFQSELETVYEEKNMYSDNFGQSLMEHALNDFFEPHPYAYPVIGSTQNLKNPDLQAMHEFFKQYYVAGNMALILSGDVNTAEILPLAEQYFGRLPKGTKPDTKIPELRSWTGTQERTLLAPIPIIKMRAQAWRTVPKNHPDEAAIAIAMRLLTNSNGTGYLDALTQERKVMAAMGIAVDQFNDMGVAATIAIPKMIFQSQSSADRLVQQAVDKLKTGDFSDEAFQSAKLDYLKEKTESVEDPKDRGLAMMFIYSGGNTWENYLANQAAISSLTKADIVRVVNTYFGENKMVFTKKMGTYPKDKVTKPDFAPIVPPNKEASSDYATELRNTFHKTPQPRFLDMDHDVETTVLSDGTTLYKANNPYNGIFSLKIQFAYGSHQEPLVGDLPVYLGLLGTTKSDYKTFQNQLRKIGANMSFTGSDQHFTVNVSGFDEYFTQTLELVQEFLQSAAPDKKAIAALKDAKSMEAKANAKDNAYKASAMISYLIYQQNSPELRKLDRRDIGKLKDQDFLDLFKKIQQNKAQISYVGTLPMDQVKTQIQAHSLTHAAQDRKLELFPMHTADQPKVYLMNDKETRQSIIRWFVITPELKTERERMIAQLLNDYIGGSMSSLLFQEIREFRSLAYRANSSMNMAPLRADEKRAQFTAILSTQTDKTQEALDVLLSILKNPEFNQKRFERAKLERINNIASAYPSFRDMPEVVAEARHNGYSQDPAKRAFELVNGISLEDIKQFYQEKIASQTRTICIYSNQKNLDIKQLEKLGEVRILKPDEVTK